jgi:hypothetical protein
MKSAKHSPDELRLAGGSGVRRVPRRVVLGLVLAALVAPVIGCTAEGQTSRAGETDPAVLPRKVRDALDRAARVYPQPLSGARWTKAYLLIGSDHPLYQVRGTNGRGHEIELEVTAAGRVIEVEEHGIPVDEVPAAAVEVVKAKVPDFNPTRVEAIYQAENPRPTAYGFEGLVDAAGKVVEIYVSADGKSFLN